MSRPDKPVSAVSHSRRMTAGGQTAFACEHVRVVGSVTFSTGCIFSRPDSGHECCGMHIICQPRSAGRPFWIGMRESVVAILARDSGVSPICIKTVAHLAGALVSLQCGNYISAMLFSVPQRRGVRIIRVTHRIFTADLREPSQIIASMTQHALALVPIVVLQIDSMAAKR